MYKTNQGSGDLGISCSRKVIPNVVGEPERTSSRKGRNNTSPSKVNGESIDNALQKRSENVQN